MRDQEKTKTPKTEQKFVKTTEKSFEEVITTTSLPQVEEIVATTASYQEMESLEMIQTTLPPAASNQEESGTEVNPEAMDLGTGAPDLIAMEMNNHEVSLPLDNSGPIKAEIPIEEESQTDSFQYEEEIAPTTESNYEIKTTIVDFMNSLISQSTEAGEVNKTQTTEQTQDEEEEALIATTVQPQSELFEMSAAVETKSKSSTEVKSFSEAMEEILAEVESMKDDSDSTQEQKNIEEQAAKIQNEEIKKITIQTTEATTSGFKFLDPMSIIGTSVSSEISHETEICYRGKCVKTKKVNHKKAEKEP